MNHIKSGVTQRLTSKQYEEREACSQSVRCAQTFLDLRKVSKRINKLATELEQQELFPGKEKIRAVVIKDQTSC